jgi:hypothetical protein
MLMGMGVGYETVEGWGSSGSGWRKKGGIKMWKGKHTQRRMYNWHNVLGQIKLDLSTTLVVTEKCGGIRCALPGLS